MKVRVYADIHVTDEEAPALIAAAKRKAENQGDPDLIRTVGDALVELFELTTDDIGTVADDLTILTINTISDMEEDSV